jgi:hypothetical protein
MGRRRSVSLMPAILAIRCNPQDWSEARPAAVLGRTTELVVLR